MPRARKPAGPFRYFNSSPEVIADRLVAHIDPAFGEYLLDVTQARGEAEIELDREPDRV